MLPKFRFLSENMRLYSLVFCIAAWPIALSIANTGCGGCYNDAEVHELAISPEMTCLRPESDVDRCGGYTITVHNDCQETLALRDRSATPGASLIIGSDDDLMSSMGSFEESGMLGTTPIILSWLIVDPPNEATCAGW